MPKKKVLYISGSVGLGHVTRDLAIANELRRQNPDVEISWLAPHPAALKLEETGETLHPEADLIADDNVPAEKAAKEGFKLNIQEYTMKAMGEWKQNVKAFEQVTGREQFSLVIADEAYEIAVALTNKEVQLSLVASRFTSTSLSYSSSSIVSSTPSGSICQSIHRFGRISIVVSFSGSIVIQFRQLSSSTRLVSSTTNNVVGSTNRTVVCLNKSSLVVAHMASTAI